LFFTKTTPIHLSGERKNTQAEMGARIFQVRVRVSVRVRVRVRVRQRWES
jgi:hypothetical protein